MTYIERILHCKIARINIPMILKAVNGSGRGIEGDIEKKSKFSMKRGTDNVIIGVPRFSFGRSELFRNQNTSQ